MEELKRYKISHEWWDAILEINDDEKTKEAMKEQLMFFMGGQKMIDQADGDITRAYLESISKHILIESMRFTSPKGVIEAIGEYEGFIPLDGSCGVKLVSVDTWEFSDSSFDIIEQPDLDKVV